MVLDSQLKFKCIG